MVTTSHVDLESIKQIEIRQRKKNTIGSHISGIKKKKSQKKQIHKYREQIRGGGEGAGL